MNVKQVSRQKSKATGATEENLVEKHDKRLRKKKLSKIGLLITTKTFCLGQTKTMFLNHIEFVACRKIIDAIEMSMTVDMNVKEAKEKMKLNGAQEAKPSKIGAYGDLVAYILFGYVYSHLHQWTHSTTTVDTTFDG